MTNRIGSAWLGINLFLAAIALSLSAVYTSAHASELAKRSSMNGDVIFVRGGFNVFSGGLDTIATKLSKRGVKSRIYRHHQVPQIVSSILKNQKLYGRRPIILVGHSWGANAILQVAEKLKKHRLKIRYVVTIAATNPKSAPHNIQKLTNYYFKQNGWGKPVKAAKGFRGSLKNIDMSTDAKVHHFNVDEHPKLHSHVVNNVIRFLRGKKFARQNTQTQRVYSARAGIKPAG